MQSAGHRRPRIVGQESSAAHHRSAFHVFQCDADTIITNSPSVALWMSDYDNVEVNMLTGIFKCSPDIEAAWHMTMAAYEESTGEKVRIR